MLPPPTEDSRTVAARVARARERQGQRYAQLGLTDVRCNAHAPATVLEEAAKPDRSGLVLLREAADAMRLSCADIIGSCALPVRSLTSRAPRR
jgi:magnesium chelatase family protein